MRPDIIILINSVLPGKCRVEKRERGREKEKERGKMKGWRERNEKKYDYPKERQSEKLTPPTNSPNYNSSSNRNKTD